eukprot:TRINITY_DN2051_c0_g1_i1.p1 TRINITY_DN2051_c0_g1~~TRINITY_DN2051_c0_g1_i1.p1  ORF type:complete len:483 (+),score=59.80 TRINITY_DN2051_c0_g1_i1:59-1450(+)
MANTTSYIGNDPKVFGSEHKASLLFSISDKMGGLKEILDIFKGFNLNLSRIESRPSRSSAFDYDFFVDISYPEDGALEHLIETLEASGVGISEPSPDPPARPRLFSKSGLTSSDRVAINKVPYFPRKIADLDEIGQKTLEFGAELSADHPGFNDPVYRQRRKEVVELISTYRHGVPIPRIAYTEQEIATWGIVYRELTKLFPTHACRQLNYVLPLLEANCGYGPNNIPQLEDVSNFLFECTGWRLRPVTGLLSSRDFLNGLAFRVFHSTQYIRHPSQPYYTPEPDVCHELIGHVPLFADPDFADFSQEIGLASLGATEEDIAKLATCYWYTVEFGLCKEGNKIKAYGAGLLSSFGELNYAVGREERKPEYLSFDPSDAAQRKYPITEYQPTYYVADSFQDAKEKLVQFAKTLDRKFTVRYNALTQSVELLNTRMKLKRVAKEIQSQLDTLSQAIDFIPGVPDF